MYTEDQYIREQFFQNFIEQRPGNIIIYGTGVQTRFLLESIKSDRIVGLMDAAKTGETVYGKKVLSYEEVAAVPDVYIVIIARNSVINVIFRRIQQFVTDNQIPVYNIVGKQLKIEMIVSEAKECFCLKEETLRMMIREAEVVSFDIFDTLLCRRVLRPVDVFRIMDEQISIEESSFYEERLKAEAALPTGSNYNLDDIYRQLQLNIGASDERIDELKRLEIETEKSVLKRREDVCNLLSEAYQQGKQIYLISDMYLQEETIRDILSDKGITQYHKLYVSTNHKTSKTEKLFEVVRGENNIKNEKWLHIGDNQFSDVYAPSKLGIATYKLFSTTEMLEESIYTKVVEENHSLEENVVIADFASEAFNSPFAGFHENGKLKVTDNKELAKLIIAPVLLKYVMWLSKRILENGNDLVLFPSRDGFVLKQIYGELQKRYENYPMPKSVYFYTSRRAALIAAAESKEDMQFIVQGADAKSTSERIRKRFEVDLQKLCEGEEISDSLYEALLECSNKERERYNRYLREIGIYSHKKIAFVDFVAVGTVQEALQRITNTELQGYFFLRRKADSKYTEGLSCESLYPMAGDYQGNSNLYRFYYFLENVVSSYEPSFKRMKADGRYEFYEEARTEESIAQLKEFHEAILEYCREIIASLPDIRSLNAGVTVYDSLLGFFDKDYMDIEQEILSKIINYDELLDKKVTELNR